MAHGYLAGRDLADLEQQIASVYVSNPWSGETVLGHQVVLAELGLGTLSCAAPRDPGTFDGGWSKARRAGHILARMGFASALCSRAEGDVRLYRGTSVRDGPASPGAARGRRRSPLVSATFSRRVAESHFQSDGAVTGLLYRQVLRPERLLMTFLETEAMSRQFREAEAVTLNDGWGSWVSSRPKGSGPTPARD